MRLRCADRAVPPVNPSLVRVCAAEGSLAARRITEVQRVPLYSTGFSNPIRTSGGTPSWPRGLFSARGFLGIAECALVRALEPSHEFRTRVQSELPKDIPNLSPDRVGAAV